MKNLNERLKSQQVSSQESSSLNGYAITAVAVVDVEKGIVIPDQTVLITGDRIQAIGPCAELATPKDSHLIDGKGLYLIPGLVDAHAHYFDPQVFGRVMIAKGVLLIREMAHPTEQVLAIRDALNRGEQLGPEMVATGWVLDGYPALIPPVSIAIKTPDEGREIVRQQAAAGVDEIKVYSRLDKDVFLAIVDEAQQHGLKPVGHVPESIYIVDAAAVGLKSSEHLFGFEKVIATLLGEPVNLQFAGMGASAPYWLRFGQADRAELQKVLRQIREYGMAVCPTVIVFKTGANLKGILAGSVPMDEYISPLVREIWKSTWSPAQSGDELAGQIWSNMARFVNELNQAGVTLMVGTDLIFPGIIPGYSVHEEMAIWQEAGIASADVLRSATLVPARFMGLDKRLGTIAEGKTASMVLVKANPLDDIRNAEKIEGVFLRGRYFDRNDLDQLLEEAKRLARN